MTEIAECKHNWWALKRMNDGGEVEVYGKECEHCAAQEDLPSPVLDTEIIWQPPAAGGYR